MGDDLNIEKNMFEKIEDEDLTYNEAYGFENACPDGDCCDTCDY